MSTGAASASEIPNVEAAALVAALHAFVREWASSPLASDIAGKLTCWELEAITGLLTVLGEDAAAQAWTDAHAPNDEDGDLHYTP